MLYLHTELRSPVGNAIKPTCHAREKLYISAHVDQVTALQGLSPVGGQLDHSIHISEHGVHVLLRTKHIGEIPELALSDAQTGDEAVFLHISRA